MKVVSFALGCKVNQYESEAIAELFSEKGYEIVGIDDFADIYIINTCSVTNLGDKKSRQLLRKVKRQNPDAIVVAMGCYAQTAPSDMEKTDGVNIVIGTKNRNKIVEIVENYKYEYGTLNYVEKINEEKEFENLTVKRLQNRTRAYIKIQDGCNNFCSYCIIPYARGPIRSRSSEDILNEVKSLAENGFKEIVLTGIHIASYGKDLQNTNLIGLTKEVCQVPSIERVRFSSLEPNIVTEEFIKELTSLKKVCHHFHLSLQSGSDTTLKAMNRKYTTEGYKKAVDIIRKYMPDAAITTDIIVGFPNESEKDFKESFDFAKEIEFAKIHVFPYSKKRGTAAEKMPNHLPNSIKNERCRKLLDLSNSCTEKFIEKYVGKTLDVLFEQKNEDGLFEGHTSNYIKIFVTSEKNIQNKILPVYMEYRKDEILYGRILS